ASLRSDDVERPLEPVKDGAHHPRSKRRGQGLSSSNHRLPRTEAGRRLVHLTEGDLTCKLDHLTNQLLLSDLDDLVHLRGRHPRGLDRRPGNPLDLTLDYQKNSLENARDT